MAPATTLDRDLWPLMDGPSIKADACVVCGAIRPLNQHHVVRRSAGQLVKDGKPLPKPTLTLCGTGNILAALGGRPLCHGLAHHLMLHFRFAEGRWEYLRTKEPTRYESALAMDGWAPLPYYRRQAR